MDARGASRQLGRLTPAQQLGIPENPNDNLDSGLTLAELPMAEELDPRLVKMALTIARAFVRKLPANVSVGDLEQAALLGALSAVRRHPESSGDGFDWYCRTRIRGEIIDELRRQDWASRRTRQAAAAGQRAPVVVRFDDVDELWQERFGGDGESPEDAAITRLDAAKAWATPMTERNRRIMSARFERGRKQSDVGDEEGLSEARISQLETRVLLTMKGRLSGGPAPAELPLAMRQELWHARIGGKR
jgi:RNA polymerase sigma factor (sigma-70 family)